MSNFEDKESSHRHQIIDSLKMTVPEARKYKPGAYLANGRLPDDVVQPDLLILNQPIADFGVFSRIWSHTCYRICADGGANRLYDMFQGALENRREDYVSPIRNCLPCYRCSHKASCPIAFMVI